MNYLENKQLTITRIFNAPLHIVWEAWTDENHIRQWWGPKGFTNPVCHWDPQAAGKIDIHMKGPDGNIYPMNGTFTEVTPKERIVFKSTALDNTGKPLFDIVNTIRFIGEGEKTKLELHFTATNILPEAAQHIAGMETGWNMSLDRLTDLLATEFEKRTIKVSRLLNAPCELVFDMWASPDHIKHWWGPNGFTNTIHKMDFRPGGEWEFVMHAPDGNNYPNHNRFVVIDRPEKIILEHAKHFHFIMVVTFEEKENKTLLTITNIFETEKQMLTAVREVGADKGLKENVDKLEHYLTQVNA